MESKYGSPSSQHSRVEAEHVIVGELQPIISLEDVQFVQQRGSNANSSDASSFSSDSSSDEFIQVDHTATFLAMSTTKEEEEDDGNAVSKDSLILEEYTRSSSFSSRVSDVTIESYIPDVSPARSPPVIQVMQQGKEDFDPHRLPPSIFAKPSSPMDWSVASNESLFSIHIGNGSFNENQIGVLEDSVDFKSGELITSDKVHESKDPKLPGELLKSKENASEVKDIKVSQDFVSSKGIVLEHALGNTPKKSVNKKDNRKAGTSIPSYTHPRKQSTCCGSMPACSCKWLTCPTCSCCDSCYRSCCSWPNSCCRTDVCCCHPTTWPCCNCNCSTWWNLCDCFSTCSNCCSRGFCSTYSWTCSIRNMLCCFSFQRLKDPESPKALQRCKCCFSCPCCCS